MENVDSKGRRFAEMPTHAGVTKGAPKKKEKIQGKEGKGKKRGKRKKGTKKRKNRKVKKYLFLER